jgi:hypothetical protein
MRVCESVRKFAIGRDTGRHGYTIQVVAWDDTNASPQKPTTLATASDHQSCSPH